MIKKMRRRVILSAMIAFSSVILLIGVLVNVIDYGIVTSRTDETISYILRYESRVPDRTMPNPPPMGPFTALPDEESNYMTRFFIVRFDDNGNIISASTDFVVSVDHDEAEVLAKQVFEGKKKRGYVKEYRYVREVIDDTTVMVFLNVFREQQFMRSLRILTLIVSVAALLLVFILVVLLSGRAIRPIEDNINRQKQFITDASHELKTPLTSISTSLDVISMEHGDDEWTDNIRSQTDRMSRLVSELVTLSRLDEELPLPGRENFSLSELSRVIAGTYEVQAKALEKTFDVDIRDDVTLCGDQASIRQMLSVLLDNTLRYSDEGGEIRFSVCSKRNKAVIEVFNTCHYDKPPDTKKLFDRFYRPDSSRSTETGGTGIGLAIAKAVVEAHGGTISASCPDGKSMTVTAVL